MIIIGRVKAGVSTKTVKLNKMLERFGGGGHVKAASATVRLNKEEEAQDIMQDLVDELIETSLQEQVSVSKLESRDSSLTRHLALFALSVTVSLGCTQVCVVRRTLVIAVP
jgi:single-stranded DNA-specific DHH superfamily exonuclease